MPEPVLIAIAAALAGKSVGNLYDLVRKKFADRKQAAAALEAAKGTAPDSPEVRTLADELAAVEAEDPAFADQLRTTWQASEGAVINTMSGNTQGGAVIQARDIQGGITFH